MTESGSLILWFVIAAFAAISAFILILLAVVVLRRPLEPNPARIIAGPQSRRSPGWTALWIILFAVVAVPLARLVYLQNATRVADVTIKVTGNFWYWTYEYPGEGNFRFDVPMLANASANSLGPRDGVEHLVVPVGETVRIVSTGTRLFYAWAIPSIGARLSAVPGLTNESWFKADKEGVYYGQPTELCAVLHTFMPVEIEVVSRERFEKWAADASRRLAAAPGRRIVTAAQ